MSCSPGGRPSRRRQCSRPSSRFGRDEPIPPSRLQPKLPRDLVTICLKCLEKDPARRYASAIELADDLRRFEAGETIQARPVGGHERLWRWCRREPPVASLALALLAGLVGVATQWWRAEYHLSDAIEQRREAEASARSQGIANRSLKLANDSEKTAHRRRKSDSIQRPRHCETSNPSPTIHPCCANRTLTLCAGSCYARHWGSTRNSKRHW